MPKTPTRIGSSKKKVTVEDAAATSKTTPNHRKVSLSSTSTGRPHHANHPGSPISASGAKTQQREKSNSSARPVQPPCYSTSMVAAAAAPPPADHLPQYTVPLAFEDNVEDGTVASAAIVSLRAVKTQRLPRGDDEAKDEAAAGQPRTTNTALQDLLYTYVGITSLEDFAQLQASAAALSEHVVSGSSFAHEAVRPSVPPALQAWMTRHRDAADAKAEDAAEDEQETLLLPSLDALPPCTRCDADAVTALRRLFKAYFVSLTDLIRCTEKMAGRWGRLDERERKSLQDVVAAERRARVRQQDVYDCFALLNLEGEGLTATTAELRQCRQTSVLRLSNNPRLNALTALPPHAHTLLACACGLQTVEPSAASEELLVLGASYNRLPNLAFAVHFPSLAVLDLSFNYVHVVEDVVQALCAQPTLREVSFAGNPIALLDTYRRRVTSRCPRLERLDGFMIESAERQPLSLSAFATRAAQQQRLASTTLPMGANKARQKVEPKEPVVLTPEELAAWTERINRTVAATVELLSIGGLRTASCGAAPTVTHQEDLLPAGALWRQALTSTADELAPMPEPSATALGSNPRRPQQRQTVVPLYECRSEVVLRGAWGGPEGVLVELTVSPDGSSRPSSASNAVSRLRKAVAAGASPDPYQPGAGGSFSRDLPLGPTLAEALRQPLELTVEVRDTYTMPPESVLTSSLEGTASSRGGGRKSMGAAAAAATAAAAGEARAAEPTVVTQSYAVGTMHVDPAALLLREVVPVADPEALPERGVLRTKDVVMRVSEADLHQAAHDVQELQQALREALHEHTALQVRASEHHSEASSMNNAPISPTVTPRGSARKQGSNNAVPHPLQEELLAAQSAIVTKGLHALAARCRLAELRQVQLTLECQLSLGRGPLPVVTGGETTGKKKATVKKQVAA